MSDIPSQKLYQQIEGVRFRAAVSESVEQDQGAAINYLNDQDTANIAHFAAIAGNSFLKYTSLTQTSGNYTLATNSSEVAFVVVNGTYSSTFGTTITTVINGTPNSAPQPIFPGLGPSNIFQVPTTVVLPPNSSVSVTGGNSIYSIVMKSTAVAT